MSIEENLMIEENTPPKLKARSLTRNNTPRINKTSADISLSIKRVKKVFEKIASEETPKSYSPTSSILKDRF